ncbi:PP2C family serine/threonine-protein phosphatase [Pedobacter sp. L105]|uniref:PP2C family protein-serine/threonine phosphatase n=1 Tax=Pedobacter sp. L105 TaxID=1641871 RepID=UPI00131B3DA1|nr:PP2C family serine/threonine-protein phosphatase [Pedobacter sp. L105]
MADHLFGITDTGKVRDNNEDVFIAQEVMNGQFLIAGVIDGVGGYEGGEVAAAITKEVILTELTSIGTDVITQLSLAFSLANEEILARKLLDPKLEDMACVATLAVIDRENNLLHYIHVGDTRLYLFRDNSLVKLSKDQSFVGFLEDSGRLTEEAAMQHPRRNQINQALGLSSTEEISDAYCETGSSPFLPADLILICSDGLTDMVPQSGIITILGTDAALTVKGKQLIEAANDAGGKDNVTVVLAMNDKAPVLHDISRPLTEATAPAEKTLIPVQEAKTRVNEPLAPVKESPASVINYPSSAAIKQEETRGKTANHNGLLLLLSILCVLFLATSIWLLLKPPGSVKPAAAVVAVHQPGSNPEEKLIRDMLLKLKGDTLLLSADQFKNPVKLSQSLTIDKDTLVIKTKGPIIFQPDSAYKGPAVTLSSNCKYIVINQLVLENFETGIVSYKNAAELKNVRFNNCKYPLQVSFQFPDHSFINGRMSKRPYLADSLLRKL